MKILIAEDDPISRRVLEASLRRWGHEVVACADGTHAHAALTTADPPQLAVLDWMMPGMDGPEICRRVRGGSGQDGLYIILLTARGEKSDIVEGLESGANDYLTKPFDREELRARVAVGVRVVELQQSLAERVRELELALAHVKQLQGILPICCYCKKIRDDSNYWQQVEAYIAAHSGARFSHGVCPDCYETVLKPALQTMDRAEAEK
ncbi:MAG: response regulator transcription factor [Armatimonadota bacterium]